MIRTSFTRTLNSRISAARRGVLHTAHGDLQTPFFMPIATKAAVKTLSSFDIERLGSPILLSNTYHLYLRPGLDVFRAHHGLHHFMSWKGAILTDSGGYQVFSLAKTRKISEEGVMFSSHIDGSKHLLTPELSMEVQQAIGSDIAMVLDECTPSGSDATYLDTSLARTVRWAERSKVAFENGKILSNNNGAQLFGIVQGGVEVERRLEHAQALMDIGFDGYAIGGLSVGESFDDACEVVTALDGKLPRDFPRYFMGGAQPHEIVEYVRRGVDMMDCVLPTRNARHGLLYRFTHGDITKSDFYETVHVTNERFRLDMTPLVANQNDAVTSELSRYSLSYIRHLFSIDEILAYRLMTFANLHFYLELMKRIREAIDKGSL
ncbi:tRNA guanosine(34) transglycosylase Tgt [Candidatus Uhrbacteria bacterium]|nr:tRNA guanosine(34) transglycosylase Tgt [Candidatus Uhrbacteria bacterium]